MGITVEADALLRSIEQDFMNKMQIAQHLQSEYDGDTINLLSKADYNQRRKAIGILFRVMQNATQRRIKIERDLMDCEFFLDKCYTKKKKKKGKIDEMTGEEIPVYYRVPREKLLKQIDIWEGLKDGTLRLKSQNDAILTQVRAGLALFRGTGIFNIFEAYEEAVSDILGLEKAGLKQAHAAKDIATKDKPVAGAEPVKAKPSLADKLKKKVESTDVV